MMSLRLLCATAAVTAGLIGGGCASETETGEKDFHTSGSAEADQRAEQIIARQQQMRTAKNGASAGDDDVRTLYQRLGGEAGLARIASEFVDRALADPRVNWRREGVRRGGMLGVGRRSAEWEGTPEQVRTLKRHMTQFLTLATGGPVTYEGRTMRASHADFRISNAEFDAAVGDLKTTLDALGVATQDQREMLAIVESTRPQIVEVRR